MKRQKSSFATGTSINPLSTGIGLAIAVAFGVQSTHAASYTWTQDSASTQDWTLTGNWTSGAVDSGPGATTDTLTFFSDITTALSSGTNLITTNVPALTTNVLTLNGNGAGSGASNIVLGTNAATWTLGGTAPTVNLNGVNGASPLNYTIAANLALGGSTTFTGNGTAGFNVSGAISGTFGITKAGSSTLILSGSNSYTGTTTLSGGTLKNGSATAFTNKGALAMSGTSVFDLNGFNAGVTDLLAGVTTSTITNTGTANATLTVSAKSDNTIASLITDGATNTLAVNVAASNNSSNFFPLASPNTFSGGLTLMNGGVLGTRLRMSGTIVTTGAAGAIVSSPFGRGPITIGLTPTDKAGIMLDSGSGSIIANDIVFNTALGTDNPGIRLDTTGYTFSGTITANQSNAMFSSGGGATLTGQVTGSNGLQLNTSNVTITLNNATANANNYNGNTTIGSSATLVLGAADQIPNGAGKGDVADGGFLKLGGFNETINGLTGAGVVDGVSGTPTLTLGDNNATGNTFSGVIKNTAGTLALTKIGAGTQTLSGTNTYTGTTTIGSGTLAIGGAGSLGSGSYAGSIVNSSAFVYNSSATQTLSGVVSGTGSFTQAGPGVLILSGSNTYSAGTAVNAGTLTYLNLSAKPASGTTTVAAGATLGLGVATSGNYFASTDLDNFMAGTATGNLSNVSWSATSIVGIDTTAGNFAYTVSGSSTRGLAKLGSNTLTLSGTNNYSGGTTVGAGTLALTGAIVGNVTINSGGVLSLGSAGPANVGSAIPATSMVSVAAGGQLLVTATGDSQSASNYSAFSLSLTGQGADTNSAHRTVYFGTHNLNTYNLPANVTVAGGVQFYTYGISNTINLGGTFSGTGDMSFVSDGAQSNTFLFSGNSAASGYAGSFILTNVGANIVSKLSGGNNRLPTTATLSLQPISTHTVSFDLNANSQQLAGLIGSGTGASVLNSGAGTPTLTINNTAADTFAGVLGLGGANFALSKSGAGTLTLSGSNTYTGSTTASSGTIALTGGTGRLTNTSSVTIAGGGALQIGDSTAATNSGVINRVNTSALLAFNSGILTMAAPATGGSTSQTFASLTVNSGPSVIGVTAATGTTNLIFTGSSSGAGYTRNTGGVLMLTTTTGFSPQFANAPTAAGGSAVAGTSNRILIGATLNNDLVAAASGTFSAPVYTTSATAGTAAAAYTDINADVTSSAGTLSGPVAPNAIRFNGGSAYTLTLASGTSTVASGMILVGSAVPDASAISGGAITSGNGHDLIVVDKRPISSRDSHPFNLTSTITDSGATPIALTIAGGAAVYNVPSGQVLLGSSNTYTGGTILSGGEVLFGSDSSFGAVPGSPQAGNITIVNTGYLKTNGVVTLNANRGISLVNNAIATLDAQNGTLTVPGIISGTGVVCGPGNRTNLVILTGSNTFAGQLTIQSYLRANDGVGLPLTANLSLADNDQGRGTLETSGTFTRSVGSGAGQVQWGGSLSAPTYQCGGFSAVGGPLTINLGGQATPVTLTWGSTAGFNLTELVLADQYSDSLLTWMNPIALGGSARTFMLATGKTAVVAGALSGAGGGVTLANSPAGGGGILALTGTNTYTGATTGNVGTIRAVNGVGLPTASLLTLNGGVFETSGTLTRTLGSASGNVQLTGGVSGFSANGGAATVALGGTASPTVLQWGNTNFAQTALVLNETTADSPLTFLNSMDLNGANRTINVNANTATIPAPIINSGSVAGFTKGGAGTLVLTANSTYTGATTISAGTLQLGDGTTDGSIATSGTITNNGALVFNLVGSQTLGGTINGIGSLTKTGTGSLTLANANTFTGDTAIGGGTLITGGSTSLQSSTLNYNNQGGALSFGTQTAVTLGGLKGAQNLTLLNTSSAGVTLSVGNNNANTSYTGVFNGTNSAAKLTKIGTGTLTLDPGAAASETISNVQVSAGTLAVNSGTMTVSTSGAAGGPTGLYVSGGTFLVSGGVVNANGYVTVNGGATLSVTGGTLIGNGGELLNGYGGTGTVTLSGSGIMNLSVLRVTQGTGTVNLNGGTLLLNNFYSGGGVGTVNFNGTTVTAKSNNTAFIPTACTWNVKGGGAIFDTAGFNITIPSALVSGTVGDGGLTKKGAGMLTLTAANTYTGATRVNAGTLAADFTSLATGPGDQANHIASSSALQMGGGTLLVTGVANGAAVANTAWTAQAAAGTNLYTLTFGAAPAGLVVGQAVTATGLSGAYVASQSTGSTVTVYSTTAPGATGSDFGAAASTPVSTQTFAGTTFNAGASAVIVNANTGNGTVVNLGSITRNVGAAVDFTAPSGSLSTTNGILTSAGSASAILTGNGVAFATMAGSDWAAKDATNTWIVGLSTVAGYSNSTATALSGNADVAAGTDTNLSGNTSIASLRFNQPSARTISLAPGATLTTGGILNTSAVGSYPSLITGGTLSGVAGQDLVVINNNASSTFTIASAIADNTSATGLSKSGTGALTLAGANTYTGATTLAAGQLNIASTTALGGTAAVFIIDGGAIDNTSGADLTLANNNAQTWNGDFTYVGSSKNLDLGAGAVTLTGNRQVTVSANTLTVDGVIGGAYGLTKSGTGTLILTASNSYTGATSVNAGTLLTNNPATLPGYGTSGLVAFNGGTIRVQVGGSGWTTSQVDALLSNATKTSGALGIDTTNGDLTQWTAFTTANFGSLGLTKSGSGTLTLNQANTYTGATTLNGGTLQIGDGTSGSIATAGTVSTGAASGATLAINLPNGGTFGNPIVNNFGAINLLAGGTNTLTGNISGYVFGVVNQSGTGTTVLSGNNTYFGPTNINAGVLQLNNQYAAWETTVNVGVNNGLAFGVTQANIGGLSGTGNLSLLTTGGSGVALTVGNNSQNSAYTGTITGTSSTASLLKTGTGTFTYGLAAPSTIATVNVSAGMLLLTGGTLTASSGFVITGSGAFEQTGGTFNTAYYSHICSTLNVLGGTLNNTGELLIGYNVDPGPGTINVSGSGTISAYFLRMGNGYNATVNLSTGGTIQAAKFFTDGGGSTLNMDGGTIRATSNAGTTFIQGLDNAYIKSGGITFDTAGNSATIAQPLQTGIGLAGNDGGLTKIGGGTLTLSGSNSYNGGTVVNSGTLLLANASALGATTGNLVVNVATLDLRGNSLTVGALSGTTGGVITSSTSGSIVLTVGGANNSTFGGVIQNGSGSLALTNAGSGNLTLTGANTFSGDTVLSSGTLTLGVATALQNSTLNYNNQGGALSFGSQTAPTLGGLKGVQNLTLLNAIGTGVALSVGNNNQSTLFTGTISGTNTAAITKIGTGTLTLDPGAATANTLGFLSANGGTLILKSGTFTNSGTDPSISAYVIGVGARGGTLTVDGATVNVASGMLKFGAALTNGNFNILSGTVFTTSDLVLGHNASAVGTQSGGTVTVSTVYHEDGGTGSYTLTGGTLTTKRILDATGSTDPFTLNLNGGTLRSAVGTTNLIDNSGKGGAEVAVYLGAGNTVIDTTSASATIVRPMSDMSGQAGAFTKAGVNTLTLSASNSYSGGTTVSAGTLKIGNTNALGTGSLTVNGGTLDLNGNSIGVAAFSGAGGAVTNTVSGTSTLTTTVASGTSSYAGNIANGTGAVILTNSGAGTLILSGSLSLAGLNANSGVTQLTQSGSVGAVSVVAGATLCIAPHSGGAYNVLDTSSLAFLGADASSDIGIGAVAALATELTGLNSDAVVNSGDYGLLDYGFQTQVSGVPANSQGNGSADSALQESAPVGAGVTAPEAVPEPGMLGLLLIGAMGLFGRRSGRNSARVK